MHGRYYKLLSVALSVALVFYCLVPVPVGVRAIDDRIEEAEAIAPAIPAAIILGTGIAACGVYIAGSNLTEYNANLSDFIGVVQDAWISTYPGLGSSPNEDLAAWDEAVQSCVTPDGKVDLGKMQELGIIGAIQGTVTGTWGDAHAVQGTSSNEVVSRDVLTFGDYSYVCGENPPVDVMSQLFVSFPNASNEVFSWYLDDQVTSKYYYICTLKPNFSGRVVVFEPNTLQHNLYPAYGYGNETVMYQVEYRKNSSTGVYEFRRCSVVTNERTAYYPGAVGYGDAGVLCVPDNWKPRLTVGGSAMGMSQEDDRNATVEPGVYDGTFETSDAQVEPFSPTDELIAAGFNALDVLNGTYAYIGEEIGEVGDSIADLQPYLNQIGTALNGMSSLLGGVGGIADVLNAMRIAMGQLNTKAGSIDGKMDGIEAGIETASGAITSGIDALGDAVSSVGEAVNDGIEAGVTTLGNALSGIDEGIRDLSGDISANWEGLLTWLGDTPLARLIADIIAAINAGVLSLELAIEAVQTAIGTAVTDLVGAIEGITFPEIQFPEFPEPELPDPPWKLPSIPVGLPELDDSNGAEETLDALLRQKAPWAYYYAVSDTLNRIDVDSNDSWYIRIENLPLENVGLDSIEFDANDFMKYSFNGVRICDLIRYMVTFGMCFALLALAKRQGEKMLEGM